MPRTVDGIATEQLVAFVLVMARVGGIFLLAPAFSARALPMKVKVVVAAAISFALTPVATNGKAVPLDPAAFAPLIVKEAAVGIAFALSLAVVTAAVQFAASLADTLIGFSFAQLVDPMSSVQGGPIGALYGMVATIVFMVSGGDRLVVLGLARSYSLVPLTGVPHVESLAGFAAAGLSQVFVIGLELAAPILLALLVTDCAFGLVARMVPQLNVFFVGIPVKIMLGVGVIAASLPFVVNHLGGDIQSSVIRGLSALRP